MKNTRSKKTKKNLLLETINYNLNIIGSNSSIPRFVPKRLRKDIVKNLESLDTFKKELQEHQKSLLDLLFGRAILEILLKNSEKSDELYDLFPHILSRKNLDH